MDGNHHGDQKHRSSDRLCCWAPLCVRRGVDLLTLAAANPEDMLPDAPPATVQSVPAPAACTSSA